MIVPTILSVPSLLLVVLTVLMTARFQLDGKPKRVGEALLQMNKLDLAPLEQAHAGV